MREYRKVQAIAADAEVETGIANVLPQIPDVLQGFFPESLAFVQDPAQLKWALCTRRAAKTYSVGGEYIDDARSFPGAKYLFLGLTRETARNQFWVDVLKNLDDRYNIGIKFNESRLEAVLPNGARIQLVGADANEKEKRKQLGGKNRKITIDEAQDWRIDLKPFVYDTLLPTVADLRGSIALIGTPGNNVNGFFHQVTKGSKAGYVSPESEREPGWSGHSWTTHQNPYMAAQFSEQIAKRIAANPRVVETPGFRQMYLGEWVIDLEARCYKYDPSRNVFKDLPVFGSGEWHYVLGVDLGYFPDPSAFVLTAYHDYSPILFIIKTWKQWKMDITDVANRIRKFYGIVEKEGGQISYLVIDGANKQAVEEMRRRHGLPLQAADKRGKEDFIEIMNSELILGNIQLNLEAADGVQNDEKEHHESLSLADEWEGLIWDPNAPPGSRKEHPGCPNHLCDGALYNWRWCYTYLHQNEPKLPPAGSAEWQKREADRMQRMEEEALENKQANEKQMSGWEETGGWGSGIL
jgi:hypothetical protein